MIVALATGDDDPLVVREAARGVRRIGDDKEHEDGPDNAERADDHELPLPGRKRVVDLTNAVPEQAAERNAEAVRRVPDANAEGLLGASEPS